MQKPSFPEIDEKKIYQEITKTIKGKVTQRKKDGVVVGLSGGVDSTVAAKLAVDALGKHAVSGLFLGERDSFPDSEKDALFIGHWLGIQCERKKITKILRKVGIYKLFPPVFWVPRWYQARYAKEKFEKMKKRFGRSPFLESLAGDGDEELSKSIAYVRAKNRIRMVLLYFFAEVNNVLVLDPLNRTEWLTGLFVPFDEGTSDLMPLKNFYKTHIKKLAKFLKVPENIVKKAPSPDLAPGITDEDILGISYEKLDLILYCLEQNTPAEIIAETYGVEHHDVVHVQEIVNYSEPLRRRST